ncbi:hypothetical protein NFI96_008921 [Prochilodus magdalenae]|nr:hypothetical protein NFI96_008921 [Prochilodus magdalenae]
MFLTTMEPETKTIQIDPPPELSLYGCLQLRVSTPPEIPVLLQWTVRDDISSAAAQCSVGHPPVLHQWTQGSAHGMLSTGRCPWDAAHGTLPMGRCPWDAAYGTGHFWLNSFESPENRRLSALGRPSSDKSQRKGGRAKRGVGGKWFTSQLQNKLSVCELSVYVCLTPPSSAFLLLPVHQPPERSSVPDVYRPIVLTFSDVEVWTLGISRAASVLLSDPCFQLHSIQHLLGEGEASAAGADHKHFSLHASQHSHPDQDTNPSLPHVVVAPWQFFIRFPFSAPHETCAARLQARHDACYPVIRRLYEELPCSHGDGRVAMDTMSNTDYISAEEEQKVEQMLALLTEESKQAAATTAPTSEDDLCPICYAHSISAIFKPCSHKSCNSSSGFPLHYSKQTAERLFYTSAELYRLRLHLHGPPPSALFDYPDILYLPRRKYMHRGSRRIFCRAGSSSIKSTWTTVRRPLRNNACGSNRSVLIRPTHLANVSTAAPYHEKTINFGLFNIRSLTNKGQLIQDIISDCIDKNIQSTASCSNTVSTHCPLY